MKKIINGHLEFGKEIVAVKFSTQNMRLLALFNLINGLSGGCGCNRKAREISAINGFRSVCNILTDSDKSEIKTHFNVESVDICEGGAVFCSF
jgi:hypothetical protein